MGFSWPLGRVEGLGWARPGLASAGRLPQGEAEAMPVFYDAYGNYEHYIDPTLKDAFLQNL